MNSARHPRCVGSFAYHVGISSLEQIASRDDRVCVLNILGSESREVTPVSHQYSGANVVCGTAPGKGGSVLPTALGGIPVYNNVREALSDGRHFDTGVVYLPPSAARDGVAELVRVNRDLRKIFIITEKIAVRDAREIRAMGQQHGIDIFGANGLGAADSWNQVRIGGGLGGDDPGQALRRGSIAIFSNSGGFSTTIAQYLRMNGWGTTTIVSSGKDVYIHYAAPEFAFALANDARSKAAVLYCEPGGFYEREAVFTKPVVACVVGRWKSHLTRAVGHAGAMAGGADDAAAKERWFMDKFGVNALFTPDRPVFSARGAVVNNIAHIPAALTAVMRANATLPDFAPEGHLGLKAWFGSDEGLELPDALRVPVVEALAPYGEQIAALGSQIGRVTPRQPMKDASGASQMDPSTQVSSLHGTSMLQAAGMPFEAHLALALLHNAGGPNDHRLIAAAVASQVNLFEKPALTAARLSREAGNPPNVVLAAAAATVGRATQAATREALRYMIERFHVAGLGTAFGASLSPSFDVSRIGAVGAPRLCSDRPDARARSLLAAIDARRGRSVFLRWLAQQPGHPTESAVLAAVCATLAWGPLSRKRISRTTAESLPWWLHLFGTLIGASARTEDHQKGRFAGLDETTMMGSLRLGSIAFAALLGRLPTDGELPSFEMLLGLLLTNGPGAISAQGAKGAVSADGPEVPDRIELNKAMMAFLTHTGYTHGGNGYEGIAFLREQFRDSGLTDAGSSDCGIDLEALAALTVQRYQQYKTGAKAAGQGELARLPGINHPVFQGKAVNHDPRERFVASMLESRNEFNVFHQFYLVLVRKLFEAGLSRNVFCVNIDAVIAAQLLKVLWQPLQSGQIDEADLQAAAFTLFLHARMIGCAAEIDDHLNRGRNMDTRTAASACRFVA